MDFGPFDHPQPQVTTTQAEVLVDDVYGIAGNAQPLSGERDRSFLIDSGDRRYVLKIANNGDHPKALQAQAAAIDWALSIDSALPLARVVPTSGGTLTGINSGYKIQLSEYVEGRLPKNGSQTPGFRRHLGSVAARLDKALAGFGHPVLRREFPWSLIQLPQLRALLTLVDEQREMIEREIDSFEKTVLPVLERLASQPIHGDLNSDNLVLDPFDPERVGGVFDFGDVGYAPAVVDLAIAATYQCTDADPLEVMVQMASGYHMERSLSAEELSVLPDLVAARCAQSLLMSARQIRANPDNADYFSSDVDDMVTTLEWLTDANRSTIVDALVDACSIGTEPLSRSDALASRLSHMAASYHLSYSEPVHAISAEGVWIVERGGQRLLDAYNNVPHVGHGHPQVLAALSAQSGRLNTNTRYLVDNVGEYAERLAGLLPDPLSVVFFTNSGSEANDLAYRIATTISGGSTAIKTANAYHGATTITSALSPEEHDGATNDEWSVSVDLGKHLVGSVDGIEETLPQTDTPVAMVIVDTIFSTEGIHLAPLALLDALKDWVGTRGGLLVADEVQAGFGRVGSQFWGFGEVIPDIVTLGKPIGNGYPMGAVVTTREIADQFAAKSTYFSTFAGSPVAAAVGNAVLDVIESEHLASHADEVGGYVRQAITDFRHRSINAVRGAGLFVGVELETEQLAINVVNEMRHRGILIGRTGPGGNVLKIRPPMVFQLHHADMLLTELHQVLG